MRPHCPRPYALILGLALAATGAGCGGSRPEAETAAREALRASAARAAKSVPDPRRDSAAAANLSIGTPAAPGRPTRGAFPENVSAPGASSEAPAPQSPPRLSPALPTPAPAAIPEVVPPAREAVALEEKFEPPVLRQAGRLETPPGRKHGQIELELRVNEDGLVDEFRWVAGDADTVLLRAALDNVRVMRFDPARRGGKPVPA